MTRTSRRLSLALFAAGTLALSACGTSPSVAQTEEAGQHTDFDVAASVRAFAAMPSVADEAIAYWTQRYGAPPKAVADQLRASAHKAFDPARLAAQLPPPSAPDAAASRALANYQAAADRLAKTSAATEASLRRDAQAADARLSARADREAIEALAEVMPEPARVGERAVMLRRMLAALDAVRGGLPDDLRTADAAKLDAAVSEIVADVRRPSADYAGGLPTPGTQIEAARGVARLALIELSPADIDALRVHYASPAGRTRRQSLAAALNVADDQAAQAMLVDFITALRRLRPEAAFSRRTTTPT